MDNELGIKQISDLFKGIVDELIPANEIDFKKYAKKYLNPLSHFEKLNEQKIDINKDVDILNFFNIENGQKSMTFKGAKLDEKSQLNYSKWSIELSSIFFIRFFENLDKSFSDSQILELKHKFDSFLPKMQLLTPIEMEMGSNKIINYFQDSFQKQTPKISENLYYWDFKTINLMKLYELLLKADFIECNDSFVESFKEFKVNPKQKTKWKDKKQTSLFALLFLIYGGQNGKSSLCDQALPVFIDQETC